MILHVELLVDDLSRVETIRYKLENASCPCSQVLSQNSQVNVHVNKSDSSNTQR